MEDHCHVDKLEKSPTQEEQKETVGQVLAVWGMGCPNCAARVHNSLIAITGVVDAYVDHQLGAAYVLYNSHLASVDDLLKAVTQAGGDGRHEYRAQPVHFEKRKGSNRTN